MSSAEFLREFISQRLSAAAEEIFTVCRNTIIQYEEEIDRQHRLLDIFRKPQVKLHRIDLPQQHVCKEHVVTDQQLYNQEEPEPPQIKEEREELCTNQEGEQLGLKQEIQSFMVTPIHEESDQKKPEPDLPQQPVCKEEDVVTDQQRHNQERNSSLDQEEPEPSQIKEEQKEHCTSQEGEQLGLKQESQSFMVIPTHEESDHREPEPNLRIQPADRSNSCDTCGKGFASATRLKQHMRTHTGEKRYPCSTCGKRYLFASHLKDHIRSHTGEKPYSCKACGKKFTHRGSLLQHMRTHTGERPFSCLMCGKNFTQNTHLLQHMRRHTGEKPYSCNTCGKRFMSTSLLRDHITTHTGEKPYSCNLCDKKFLRNCRLADHMRTHTGEKPFSCKICGKKFIRNCSLTDHMKTHAVTVNSHCARREFVATHVLTTNTHVRVLAISPLMSNIQ